MSEAGKAGKAGKEGRGKACLDTQAKQCPHCQRWALKDDACNYIFACGWTTNGTFQVGTGCGKSWCWECGKKYCGAYIDEHTGIKLSLAKDVHNSCCAQEKGFTQENYCPGGHSTHCRKRW
jgi:hypothetical protein